MSNKKMHGESDRYPLQAFLWCRKSTQEWVLEICGEINGCFFSVRHTEPITTAPEDVARLPTMYAALPDAPVAEPVQAQASDELVEALIEIAGNSCGCDSWEYCRNGYQDIANNALAAHRAKQNKE